MRGAACIVEAVTVSRPTRRSSVVVLTLIAEVLSGETLVTPGGPVDNDTACCPESFTWDGWLAQLRDAQPEVPSVEVTGRRVVAARALAE
jgi:hypothetical protein